MKSFTSFAVFAAIALCALLSSSEVSATSDEGNIDVDIDIEGNLLNFARMKDKYKIIFFKFKTVTIDLVKATTIIFNTILSLLLPVLLQIAPLLIDFLEDLLY